MNKFNVTIVTGHINCRGLTVRSTIDSQFKISRSKLAITYVYEISRQGRGNEP